MIRRPLAFDLTAVLLLLAGLTGSGAARAADAVTPLFNFTGGEAGSLPYTELNFGSDGYLYGATWYGSDTSDEVYGGWGTLYKVLPDGSGHVTLHIFSNGDDGAIPYAGLIQGQDGAFYGSTLGSESGSAGYGTVFRVTGAGDFTTLHVFGGADGRRLAGALLQLEDGQLLGVTQNGGDNDLGIIFSIRPDGSDFRILHQFDTTAAIPQSGLTLSSSGMLYGTTSAGGSANAGTLFRMNVDGSDFTVLHAFNGGTEGGYPWTALSRTNADGFFGGTIIGGNAGCGTIYRYSDADGFSVLHAFEGATEGCRPEGKLLIRDDGLLYGTTLNGGSEGAGSAWQMTQDGDLVGTITFDWSAGLLPSGLVETGSGLLYGTSVAGGSAGAGSVYALDPNGFSTPPVLPTLSMDLSRRVISGNQKASLSWASADADQCTASGDWSGEKPLSGNEKLKPRHPGRFVYTLSCQGSGGSTSHSVVLIKLD